MREIEQRAQQGIFDKKFNRYGGVIAVAKEPLPINNYQIVELTNGDLPEADRTVRQVEAAFAPSYDEISLRTPGMRDMAERDTTLLENWLGDIRGKKVLEIGPGTGRITLPLADAGAKVYAVDTATPYLEIIAQKASLAGVDPNRLKLGAGDAQSLSVEKLLEFTEGEVDIALIWFGPLALMTTNPQGVLDKCASALKPLGKLAMSTNSLNGLAYRIPEAKIQAGANPDLPLGYKPSIATRRSFSGRSVRPDGMILADGSVLPANFYSPTELRAMIQQSGLEVTDVTAITRLSGLFPADPSDSEALRKYFEIIKEFQKPGEVIPAVTSDPALAWRSTMLLDITQRERNIDECVYPAIIAEKP